MTAVPKLGAGLRGALGLGLLGFAACASVLGLSDIRLSPFEHRPHVTKGIPCTRCHAGILEAGDEGPTHIPPSEDCISCHEDPHDTRPCDQCHGATGTVDRLASAKRHLRFSHALHLDGVNGNCARCHDNVKNGGEPLLPTMASCLSCHAHADTFTAQSCDDCHHDLEGELRRPESHLVHDEDYLDRHGIDAATNPDVCSSCHLESSCASCHGVQVAALPQRFDFANPKLSGLHRAGFRSRHGREAAAQRGLCLTCHREQSCLSCHAASGLASGGEALRNPHPASGWVGATGGNAHGPAARRDPISCASCHGGAGEALCVSCHRVGGVGGSVHPVGFDSALRPTRDAPCRKCHS